MEDIEFLRLGPPNTEPKRAKCDVNDFLGPVGMLGGGSFVVE